MIVDLAPRDFPYLPDGSSPDCRLGEASPFWTYYLFLFLEKQLRRLPRQQREAIRLSFFKGLSHREISIKTRTPLGTVKTRLELGLQKLTQYVRPLQAKI